MTGNVKGVYRYEYFDDMEKFEEHQLPTKEHFYSRLNESHISNDDWAHT